MTLAALLTCAVCGAQEIVLPQVEGPVPLNGPWQVTAGDPDGQAETARGQWHPMGVYAPAEHPAQPEVLWFRVELKAAEPMESPALLISPVAAGCQIFVDGREAANCNQLSAPNDGVQREILVHLPPARAGAPFSLAIRLYRPSYIRVGRLMLGVSNIMSGFHLQNSEAGLGLGTGDVLFGSAGVLAEYRAAHDATRFYDLLPEALLCLAELIGGALLFAVFAYDRRSEYAWFAVFLWLDGSCSLLSVFERVYPLLSPAGHYAADYLGLISRYAPLTAFLAAFTRVGLNRWTRAYQWILVILPFLMVLNYYGIEFGWWHAWDSSYVQFGAQIPFVIGSLGFLAVQWRLGNKEAGLLLPSFLLANAVEIGGILLTALTGRFERFRWGRFGFDFDDLSMFFFLISIVPIMLFRHRRVSLDHARATAELDAAREVQRQLVPTMLPTVRGYALEAAYLPAAEVGGDFYQALVETDGSLLIVVGDVSGKGLKAAMRGTLALGALIALAREGLEPAMLLQRLNRETQHFADGGFITCVCARIKPDGTVRLANAGHLAPYLNGSEVELDSGLPLGLADGAEYTERAIQLSGGDTLTLLSDGVPEARAATGELFGFDRTDAISRQTAATIAATAQRFGQEDDITVLTVTRTAANEVETGIAGSKAMPVPAAG